MTTYSDATRQVLTSALERLASDPVFSAESLSSLRRLIDEGRFDDVAELTAAIERPTGSTESAKPDADKDH